MAEETADAQQGFEDYWALGDGRSLRKLAAAYEGQTEGEPPTRDLHTIERWSSSHGWQARVKDRIIEESELVRAQLRKESVAFRRKLVAGIDVDVNRYLKKLADSKDEIMAGDANALDKLAKLYFQLVEEPLVDKQEVSGPGGSPAFVVVQFGDDDQGAGVEGDDDGDGTA